MGSIKRSEFDTLSSLGIDSVPKLRNCIRTEQTKVESDEYTFERFYLSFLYPFCLEPGQKSMSIDLALPLWELVLAPRRKVAKDFVAYLNACPGKYKGVTKDLWKQLYNFSNEVELSEDQSELVNYSEESAWPTILDEYAAWVNRGRKPEQTVEEE